MTREDRLGRSATDRIKKKILRDQNWACNICQNKLPDFKRGILDHIVPLRAYKGKGVIGDNSEDNLQVLCKKCHAIKTNVEKCSSAKRLQYDVNTGLAI